MMMRLDNPRAALMRLAWLGVVFCIIAPLLVLTAWMRRPQPVLPPRLPPLFTIPDFSLTNQNQRVVALSDLHGEVWVADVIFTRCAGPCPKMTHRMSEIQAALPRGAPVRLVTLTTDPAYDTPAVLRAYADRFGAAPERWWFLTGNKATLARLEVDGFKFAASEKAAGERENTSDLFVHSTFFILVDRRGRARGIYYYSEPGMKERLLQDIDLLLAER